jgi:hypothetical protein
MVITDRSTPEWQKPIIATAKITANSGVPIRAAKIIKNKKMYSITMRI